MQLQNTPHKVRADEEEVNQSISRKPSHIFQLRIRYIYIRKYALVIKDLVKVLLTSFRISFPNHCMLAPAGCERVQ